MHRSYQLSYTYKDGGWISLSEDKRKIIIPNYPNRTDIIIKS